MKQFFKQKYYGKLLSFLKYKRNKKIRMQAFFPKIDFGVVFSIRHNWKKRLNQNLSNKPSTTKLRYFLKKFDKQGQFDFKSNLNHAFILKNINKDENFITNSEKRTCNITGIDNHKTQNYDLNILNDLSNVRIALKKKYKLNSFLFNTLYCFPRYRGNYFLGKDILFCFNTIPYRLSLSRFIGNKVLFSYYKNLNKTSFLHLHKKISLSAKRAQEKIKSTVKVTNTQFYKIHNYKYNQNKKKIADDLNGAFVGPQTKGYKQETNNIKNEILSRDSNIRIAAFNKKEIAKNFIFNLEKSLYASLFRLLQFKPLYTKKYIKSKKMNQTHMRIGYKIYKVKSPWKNFTPLQIKQKISHGHIYINGKKVKSPNFHTKLNDKIELKGFIENPMWGSLYTILQKKNDIGVIDKLFKLNDSIINENQVVTLKKNVFSNRNRGDTPQYKWEKNFKQTFFFRNLNNFLSDIVNIDPVDDHENLKNMYNNEVTDLKKSIDNNICVLTEPNFINEQLGVFQIQTISKGLDLGESNQPILNFFKNTQVSKNINITGVIGNTGNTNQDIILSQEAKILSRWIRLLKIKRFSEIFYLTYKNFFLLSNSSIFSKNSLFSLERYNNIKFFFQTIGYNQSIYFLWPLISLLSIQSWNSELKNNIIYTTLKSFPKNRKGYNLKLKDKTLNSSLIQKNLKDLLNLKSKQLQMKLATTRSNIKKSETNCPAYAPDNILNHVLLINKPNISWLPIQIDNTNKLNITQLKEINKLKSNYIFDQNLIRTKAFICYASIVYGTRKCKWIHLQQQKKNFFYNKIYNKINFFELELDFFQLVYRHYKSN